MDFNNQMGRLIEAIVGTVDEFRGFRGHQIRVSAAFAKSRSRGGVLAYVVPLRFEGGSPVRVRHLRGRYYHWAMLPHAVEGREILYYIYFMLPRFLKLSSRDRLETVVHELYHIHPTFNGDLRRFPGRSRIHGDPRRFDLRVQELTDEFLDSGFRPGAFEVLQSGLGWGRRQGAVEARHYPEPRAKLLKVSDQAPEILPLDWEGAPLGVPPVPDEGAPPLHHSGV